METNNCINFLLTTAQHSVFSVFKKTLEPYGITPAQYGVLNCLWEEGESTPRKIAGKLQLDDSTISGILDRLEKKKLINRSNNPVDRRQILVILTAEGDKLQDIVIPQIEKLNTKIYSNFSDKETRDLNKFLKELASNPLSK